MRDENAKSSAGPASGEATHGPPGSCPPELLTAVYDRLRAIAEVKMTSERKSHTLQATALVHEVYLKLAHSAEVKWSGPRQFYCAAAESMRRVLIDHARHRNTQKRGGRETHIELNENEIGADDRLDSALRLEVALDQLQSRDLRMHEIVMLRYFAGQSVEQTAELMEISPRTVKREWAVARVWLRAKLGEV